MEKIILKSIIRGWRNYVKEQVENRKFGFMSNFSVTPRDPEEDYPGDNTIYDER